jgi:hypothetical protein
MAVVHGMTRDDIREVVGRLLQVASDAKVHYGDAIEPHRCPWPPDRPSFFWGGSATMNGSTKTVVVLCSH